MLKVQDQSVLQHIYKSLLAISFTFLLFVGASFEGWGQIAQRGSSTTATTTGTSIIINKPSGVQTGDVMIMIIAKAEYTVAPSSTGWNLIAGSKQNDGSRYVAALYKIVDGTEGENFTVNLGVGNTSGAGSVIAFSGVSPEVFDVTPGSFTTGGGTTTTAIRITTATNNAAVIFFGGTGNSSWSGWSGTNPTFTEILDYNNNTVSIGAAWGTRSIAGNIGNRTVSLNTGSGGGFYYGVMMIALKQAIPPTITSFTPSNACSASGTSVVIIGTNFTGATAVRFNGVSATSYTVNSATQITATLPAGATTGAISVTTTGGTATSSSSFTVNSIPSAPVVGTITQPTCVSATGSVVLNGLPSSGTWTLTRNDGVTTTGTGSSTTLSNLPAGTYTYTVTGENSSTACPGSGTGLKGEYFNNVPTSGVPVISGTPVLIRTDQTIDFNWANGGPGSPLGNDYFAVRWTGKIQPCYTETYTFTTQSDDGIRLTVNGNQIINNWTDHANTSNSGTISLNAGQKYDIVLEFYERAGQAVAQLYWSSTSQPNQIIPMTQLYSVATGCTSASSASVTINPQPTASTAPSGIAGNTTICSGTATTLTVAGGSLGTSASWNWYSGSCGGTFVGSGSSITVNPTTTTTYFVRAESTCNTTNCASGTITVNPLPTANISGDNGPLCAGDAAIFNLTGTAGAVVTYKLNSGSEQTISLTGGVATISINNVNDDQVLTLVSVTNGTCSQNLSATSTITVNPLPEIGSFN